MLSLLTLCLALVSSQVNLQSPRSRSGNSNIRVTGSTAGVNPCGNGSDTELRASRTPVATFLEGGNATNISISFGNVNQSWSMSIVTYRNNTNIIPNTTLPLPIVESITPLRGPQRVGDTTNGTTGTYLLRYDWTVDAARACRPHLYGCALRVVVVNDLGNDTYFTCSDIRVYSRAFDSHLRFKVVMNRGVVAPPPANMLSRLQLAYALKGLTQTNSFIQPSGTTLDAQSDGSYTFTLIIADTPGFSSFQVADAISADASTSLNDTLGVASVALGPDPEPESNSSTVAGAVIGVLLALLLIGAFIYVYRKKPELFENLCKKSSKGTNI